MTRNTFGGSGHKKCKKTNNRNKIGTFNQKIHQYAQVKKKAGEKNVEVVISNGTTKIVSIPGRLYKKVWIKPKDYVVITDDEIEWLIDENSQQEYDAKKCLETVINQVGIQKKKDEEIAIDDDLEFDEL
jgi:initiation factor 1A